MRKILNERQLRKHISDEVRKMLREDADPGKIDSKLYPNKLSSVDKELAGDLATKGSQDQNLKDDVAKAGKVSAPAKSLKASQTTMDFGKFVGMAIQMLGKMGDFSGGAGGDLSAIISVDKYIMDGHHRWAATLMVDPDASVGGLGVNLPGEKLVGVLNVWTAAKGQSGKPSDTDLDSLSGDAVAEKFKEMCSKGGKFLPSPDEILKSFKAEGFDTLDAAANHVKNNWDASEATRSIEGWMPPKVDMPAIEPDQLQQVADDIQKGKMDINPPYSPEVKKAVGDESEVKKETRLNSSNILLERWHKLAGLIK
jgi:hypothetical protein